ncbi:MAG TPA: prepilin-type N-terminal cleavage/methylation domain-containing protein [Candidatus Omnitrophota bacterium]|nr:prepilin-type N-terminal cleavage/methylation domain-containing protein [Candidatus Omnitrophota bacterium]
MKRGFTLVELIVVIAIIAILAAVVAPNAFKAIEKAKISGTLADLSTIKTGAMAYYGDTGSWPWICNANCSVGFVNVPTAATVTGWDGPYLEKWPATAKWGGGTYSYYNGSAPIPNWAAATATAAGAIPARHVIVANVPRDARVKMDEASDGGNFSTTGSTRHDFTVAGSSNFFYLVSFDGTLL